MKPHPYLKAYMAGLFVPSVLMIFVFAVFIVARFGYHVAAPIETVMVFPLALVPALWGCWNMVFLALHPHGRWTIGLHGAVVPAVLGPAALAVATALGIEMPAGVPTLLMAGLPALIAIYYLVWKYIVGFLNSVLGIA